MKVADGFFPKLLKYVPGDKRFLPEIRFFKELLKSDLRALEQMLPVFLSV